MNHCIDQACFAKVRRAGVYPCTGPQWAPRQVDPLCAPGLKSSLKVQPMRTLSSLIAAIFRREHYQSEASAFIEHLKQEKPDLETRQQAGRALLWDKQIDRAAAREFDEARVAQQPYVYQTK